MDEIEAVVGEPLAPPRRLSVAIRQADRGRPTLPTLFERHNVRIRGDEETTLLFVHGLGCDQSIWRFVAPAFEGRARTVRMDLMGFGQSHKWNWSPDSYEGLRGHAHDVASVADRIGGRVVLVGHSVGGMIGMLADLHAPWAIQAHAMVSPQPCHRAETTYPGGFSADQLVQALDLLASDPHAWVKWWMPMMLGPISNPWHAEILDAGFSHSRPAALIALARATFQQDLRSLLPSLTKPTLVIQSDGDLIAPREVGQYMVDTMRDCTLAVICNQGHFPQLTNPQACITALSRFLTGSRFITDALPSPPDAGPLGLGKPTGSRRNRS